MGKLSAVAKAAKEIAKKARNESLAYRRKLKKKLKETVDRPARKSLQEKEARINELEKDIALENPYMTYEDRVKYLGGKYKKGGKVKKMQAGGMAAGNTQAEIEKLDRQIEMLKRQAAEQAQAVPQRSRLGGVPGAMKALGGPQGRANLGGMKKGGKVKQMKKGGKVSSCSKRADGCAKRGKTKGRMV